jgi:hypothetical protein
MLLEEAVTFHMCSVIGRWHELDPASISARTGYANMSDGSHKLPGTEGQEYSAIFCATVLGDEERKRNDTSVRRLRYNLI